MAKQTKVQIEVPGYTLDEFASVVASKAFRDRDIDIQSIVEKMISDRLDTMISDKVDDELTGIVKAALYEGLVTSEPWEDDVQRKPISEIVKQQAQEWMTAKSADTYSGPKRSAFEKLAAEIIDKKLETEARKMLDGIKAETLNQAKDRLAKVVSERLFSNGKALPF